MGAMSSLRVVAVLVLAFLPAPPVAAGGVPSRSRSADVSAALAVDPYHLHIGGGAERLRGRSGVAGGAHARTHGVVVLEPSTPRPPQPSHLPRRAALQGAASGLRMSPCRCSWAAGSWRGVG
jgi:hypothetical protein